MANKIMLKKIMGKLHIWSLSYTPYFNLVSNFLIVSIWFLTFWCCVNLVSVIIFSMKIDYMTNGQNKILVYFHITESYFFFLAIRCVVNIHPKNNDID